MDNSKLSNANARTLAKHLREYFGVNANANEGKAALMARAIDLYVERGAEVVGGPSEESPPANERKGKAERRIRIEIHPEEGALPFVPLQLNGRLIVIHREKEVNIPPEYIEVLDHAVTTVVEKVELVDEHTGAPYSQEQKKEVRRFNYTNHGEVWTDKHGKLIEEAAA